MQPLKISDIHKVLILGSGTLGLRVALQSAISGFSTTLYDVSSKSLDNARDVQVKLLKTLVRQQYIKQDEVDTVLDRLSFTTNPEEAAANSDFINESVTEDVQIKQSVWKQFGELCPSHTVFTTNTSFLLPSMFSDHSGRPKLFCALHFHDVFVANVVDIMPHEGTEDWVIDLLFDIGKRFRQTPVLIKKESNGYIFNYMLMHILTAAGSLLSNDIGSIHDIDRSWMGNFNMPVGPFGMLDQIGLDTAWNVSTNTNTKKSLLFAELLQTYMSKGKLGIKSGEGFYKYPNPLFKQPGFLNS